MQYYNPVGKTLYMLVKYLKKRCKTTLFLFEKRRLKADYFEKYTDA